MTRKAAYNTHIGNRRAEVHLSGEKKKAQLQFFDLALVLKIPAHRQYAGRCA